MVRAEACGSWAAATPTMWSTETMGWVNYTPAPPPPAPHTRRLAARGVSGRSVRLRAFALLDQGPLRGREEQADGWRTTRTEMPKTTSRAVRVSLGAAPSSIVSTCGSR